MLREPNVVPETKKADSLLEEFKKDRSHMAVVIDEYGTISGLVTIEDILEELVGEIEDEHDIDEEEFIKISDKKFYADAKVELEDFTEFFNLGCCLRHRRKGGRQCLVRVAIDNRKRVPRYGMRTVKPIKDVIQAWRLLIRPSHVHCIPLNTALIAGWVRRYFVDRRPRTEALQEHQSVPGAR